MVGLRVFETESQYYDYLDHYESFQSVNVVPENNYSLAKVPNLASMSTTYDLFLIAFSALSIIFAVFNMLFILVLIFKRFCCKSKCQVNTISTKLRHEGKMSAETYVAGTKLDMPPSPRSNSAIISEPQSV